MDRVTECVLFVYDCKAYLKLYDHRLEMACTDILWSQKVQEETGVSNLG